MNKHRINFPSRTVIAGIGGFGANHHAAFADLEARNEVRVVATCDPMLERLGETCLAHRFDERGVSTYKTFEEMCEATRGGIELGVVATPIQCHAPMHEAFVQNQVACYLEKPPTLDPGELQRMIAVDEQAAIPTNVGFSFIHMSERLDLKRRMLDGEFGALKRMSFLGLAARKPSYFQRNKWAGRLTLDGNLLLDSCLGNAMSHFLNSMLFFANQNALQAWARPLEMDCELYRANPIEGTDTIFAACRLDSGVEFRVAATHAYAKEEPVAEERLEFERATITIRSVNNITIVRPGKADEVIETPEASLLVGVGDYFKFLKGDTDRPPQTLADCVGFVETNALFYLAAKKIHTLPLKTLQQTNRESVIAIPSIEQAGRRFIADGVFPSEAGFSWARPGGRSTVKELPNLARAVKNLS